MIIRVSGVRVPSSGIGKACRAVFSEPIGHAEWVPRVPHLKVTNLAPRRGPWQALLTILSNSCPTKPDVDCSLLSRHRRPVAIDVANDRLAAELAVRAEARDDAGALHAHDRSPIRPSWFDPLQLFREPALKVEAVLVVLVGEGGLNALAFPAGAA